MAGKKSEKDLEGRGYGMVDGKVADPNDPYTSLCSTVMDMPV